MGMNRDAPFGYLFVTLHISISMASDAGSKAFWAIRTRQPARFRFLLGDYNGGAGVALFLNLMSRQSGDMI